MHTLMHCRKLNTHGQTWRSDTDHECNACGVETYIHALSFANETCLFFWAESKLNPLCTYTVLGSIYNVGPQSIYVFITSLVGFGLTVRLSTKINQLCTHLANLFCYGPLGRLGRILHSQ